MENTISQSSWLTGPTAESAIRSTGKQQGNECYHLSVTVLFNSSETLTSLNKPTKYVKGNWGIDSDQYIFIKYFLKNSLLP